MCFDLETEKSWKTIIMKKSKKNRNLYKIVIKDSEAVMFVFCDAERKYWDNPNSEVCNK